MAVVRHAHHFFQIFKGLIVDLIFSFQERQESRDFFHDRKPEEAFKLIAVELNFLYEALFTKAVVVHSKLGYILRAISFSAIVVALVFFYKLEKDGLHSFDVGITYTLLFGAIGLDLIAVFMLIFSDWTVAALNKSWQKCFIASNIFEKYLNLKRSSLSTETTNGGQENSTKITKCLMWTRKILFRRWYESVSMFNLIDFSLKEREKVYPTIFDRCGSFSIKFLDYFGLKDHRDKIKYRSSKPLTAELWNFIFEELKVMQPTMMSSVAGIGQTRFRDTCAEAKKFFSRSELESGVEEKVEVCKGLLDVNTDVQPIDVKGDRSKSVLFDACILAKELAKMEENKWELISKVLVELLSYSASFELLENSFDDIRGKLTRLLSSRARVEDTPNGEVGTSSSQVRIKDPHRVKPKGRARRVKGQKEKAAEGHKRRCSECRKTDHDRRSCPKLVSGSSSSDAEVGAAVDENLQPSQSTQDREPTMTESFLQEFDFIYGPGV
ncbi:uncharacterized protein Pyn_14328 [Prunus yedoensis var. nudiflora]|uniref:DUF4220 domain-containing protein n=1 Tax=Prunus yedoensis var. nudiflora TaxID=2094558 RepID=A0A314XPZ3_PRUYE|nr:uncharacterized protein Pyn_14328 [Prunus yedoensis var. nudiflora]